MKLIKLFVLFISITLTSVSQANISPNLEHKEPNAWELITNKDDYQVFTRENILTPYIDIKIVASINAPSEKIIEEIGNSLECPVWLSRCKSAGPLDQAVNPDAGFMILKFVWPFKDRYVVFQRSIENTNNNTTVVTYSPAKSEQPIPKKKVLMTIKNEFTIVDDQGSSKLTWISEANPGKGPPVSTYNRYFKTDLQKDFITLKTLLEEE